MKILNHLALGVVCGTVFSISAFAVPVPNGDFSNAANNGSIQGSFLSGGQLASPLGSGPWNAQTFALAGILAPPSATIGGGVATISGLLGVGIAGQSNSAMFYQTIAGQSFAAATTYTLSVSLESGVPLSLSLLGTNGIGIALTQGGNSNVIASSLTAAPSLISLTPLSGNAYQMSLQFVTTSLPPAGNIGIQLFAGSNASLATASLLGDVTFDNVTLTAVPEPSTVGLLTAAALIATIVFRKRRRLQGSLAALTVSALLAGNAQALLLNNQTLNVTLLPNSSYELKLDLTTNAISSLLGSLSGLQTNVLQIVDGNGAVLGSLPAADLLEILNETTGGLLGGLTGDLTQPITIILHTVDQVVDPILTLVDTPLLTVSNATVTPVQTAAGSASDRAPSIKITKRQRADLNLKIKGTAADDQAVTRVEVTTNGKVRKANGTSSWKSNVKLRSGRNRIVVRAFDNAQHISAPRRVTVVVK